MPREARWPRKSFPRSSGGRGKQGVVCLSHCKCQVGSVAAGADIQCLDHESPCPALQPRLGWLAVPPIPAHFLLNQVRSHELWALPGTVAEQMPGRQKQCREIRRNNTRWHSCPSLSTGQTSPVTSFPRWGISSCLHQHLPCYSYQSWPLSQKRSHLFHI